LVAFEWTTKPSQTSSLGSVQSQEVEEEIIPITRQEEIKPPPPPPPPKVIEVLNIVDDDVEIEDELEIEDSEADDETIIDLPPVNLADEEEEDDTQVFSLRCSLLSKTCRSSRGESLPFVNLLPIQLNIR